MPNSTTPTWDSVPFGSLCLRIVNGGTPETNVPSYWGGDIPWITGADFTASGVGEFRRYVSERGIRASATSVVKQGNLLVVTRTGVGKLAIAPCDIAISQDITGIYIDPQKAKTEFVYFLLNRELENLKKLNQGTSINGIVRGDLEKHVVSIPRDPSVQKKLVAVFRSIDTAIEKTEALIAKYQQIKAGLMHDLFTRGVLPNGQLRPPREQAPELYQETAFGWIPREWGVKPCADLCSRICVGIVIQPTQYYVDDGVPAFRSANVREDGIDPNNFVYISAGANRLLAKSQLKTGDIVSVRTGYPGTSAVIPPEFQGANCIDILISTPTEKVLSEYLCDWINSSFGKGQVLRQQGGMAQQHFNVGEMRELLVALPDLNEQERIRGKVKSVSGKLAIEKALAEKLQAQKSGLMHDLLTGKVPVQVEEPEMDDG
jgi:type I restriction enzyme, S subunit